MASTSHSDTQQGESNTRLGDEAESASFRKTIASVEEVSKSKIAKFLAAQKLVLAEAKLSLSAILLSFGLALALLCIAVAIWAIINFGFSLLIYKLIPSYALCLLAVLLLNAGVGFYLMNRLKKTWQLVGFERSFSAFTQDT